MMDLDPRQYDHVTISDNDVRNIVLSYLVHNCFKETAETFISCSGMKQPADYPVDMDKRKPIFHFALEGNSLKAIELTEQLAHDLLEKNKDLHFDLLSLHFVELVSARKCTEALEFAQTKLTPFGNEEKYVEKLEDRMALLAYEEPEKSPMFHLLTSDYRQSVADELNRAILAHANLPSHSSMEMLIRQLTVVTQCLHQELGKDWLRRNFQILLLEAVKAANQLINVQWFDWLVCGLGMDSFIHDTSCSYCELAGWASTIFFEIFSQLLNGRSPFACC